MSEEEVVKLFELLPSPIKGNSDWRDYRALKLQNGVTCLLVHDKESKTTSTSCCVNVGASSDPRSLSGLAHFCGTYAKNDFLRGEKDNILVRKSHTYVLTDSLSLPPSLSLSLSLLRPEHMCFLGSEKYPGKIWSCPYHRSPFSLSILTVLLMILSSLFDNGIWCLQEKTSTK